MEVEEVEEGEEVEDVEDEDSAAESRLARKVASFGMRAGRYYTLGRIQSEAFSKTAEKVFFGAKLFTRRRDSLHPVFTIP
jgi:hypothetical protein